MSKEDLTKLSVEELQKKEKASKTMIGVFIPLIIALFYFAIRSYFKEGELDWAILTIAICTLGGPATVYPELKSVRKELKTREA